MQLNINAQARTIDAEPDTPLLWVLRDDLGLTGTKYGCGLAQCGACSVLVDDVVTRSCVMPVQAVVGRKVTTIEAIEQDEIGRRVVAAWVEHQVPQCGYCQSGQVIATTALLKQTAQPTDAEIAAAMINLCRCGTYNAIEAAVHALAGRPGEQPAGGAQTKPVQAASALAEPAQAAIGGAIAVVALSAIGGRGAGNHRTADKAADGEAS